MVVTNVATSCDPIVFIFVLCVFMSVVSRLKRESKRIVIELDMLKSWKRKRVG